MKINPEIIQKLRSGDHPLWHAGHPDGSDHRINGDTILEVSSYGTGFGIIAAISMLIRKLFRNRKKTPQDFEAEKEALRINNTCGALSEMLLEYFQAAQAGSGVSRELLSELIDTLEQMHDYSLSGKLVVPGRKELNEILKCIEEYTAETTGSPAVRPQDPAADEFVLIREQLLKQQQ